MVLRLGRLYYTSLKTVNMLGLRTTAGWNVTLVPAIKRLSLVSR